MEECKTGIAVFKTVGVSESTVDLVSTTMAFISA